MNVDRRLPLLTSSRLKRTIVFSLFSSTSFSDSIVDTCSMDSPCIHRDIVAPRSKHITSTKEKAKSNDLVMGCSKKQERKFRACVSQNTTYEGIICSRLSQTFHFPILSLRLRNASLSILSSGRFIFRRKSKWNYRIA